MSETKWSAIAEKTTTLVGEDQFLIIDSGSDPKVNKLTSISLIPVGQINKGANLLGGQGVYTSNLGDNLQFKSFAGTANKILVSSSTNTIDFTVGSTVVQTDKTNTFGAFDQIFESGRLQIKSAVGTNVYKITSSTINDDIVTTLPVLTSADTFVMVNASQILTDKTLTEPTIGNFSKALHTHADNEGGGQLDNSALNAGTFSSITGIGIQGQALAMGGNNIENALLAANDVFFVDTSGEKRIEFKLSAITANQKREITIPDSNLQLVATTDGLIDLPNFKTKDIGNLISFELSGAVTVGAGSDGAVLTSNGGVSRPQFTALSIVDSQVNDSAAISYSKLGSLLTGNFVFGNSGVATAGTMTGDMVIDNTGKVTATKDIITLQTPKNIPVGADEVLISDSEDSNNLKKIELGNLPPKGIFISSYETDVASANEFYALSGGDTIGSTTFNERAAPIPFNLTFSRLTVNASAFSADTKFALFKDGTVQTSTITITGTGSFTDETFSTSLSSGDLVSFGIDGTAGVTLVGASILVAG